MTRENGEINYYFYDFVANFVLILHVQKLSL